MYFVTVFVTFHFSCGAAQLVSKTDRSLRLIPERSSTESSLIEQISQHVLFKNKSLVSSVLLVFSVFELLLCIH